jgi:splicing factor 3A subunit 2
MSWNSDKNVFNSPLTCTLTIYVIIIQNVYLFHRNYLAHTQGKKHQAGLAKRAAMEAKLQGKTDVGPILPTATTAQSIQRVKIGRPGYEITKSRHYQTNQRCLSFQLHFPEIDSNVQPRHRFMSAFEQRVESPPDRRFQYLLIAAEPYETVAFKIPNEKIERSEGMFVTNWDVNEKKFTLTLYFVDEGKDTKE